MIEPKAEEPNNISHLPAQSRDKREIENLKCRVQVMVSALDDIQNTPAYKHEQCAFIARMALTSVKIIERDIR